MSIKFHDRDDFKPIKRGFNKKTYYARIAFFYFSMAVVYAFIAPWPLVEEMNTWLRILYALTASGLFYVISILGGGMIKGMLMACAYYFVFYLIFMRVLGDQEVAYIFGILTFLIHMPIGGVVGWTMAQR